MGALFLGDTTFYSFQTSHLILKYFLASCSRTMINFINLWFIEEKKLKELLTPKTRWQ